MRPTSTSVSSVATSNWIPINWRKDDFNIGFGVVLTNSPALTYKVQHTFDDIFDPNVTPTAFDHEFVTGSTTNDDGSYTSPIRALRLNVTAHTSGTATLTVVQSG